MLTEKKTTFANGRDVVTGLPRRITVTQEEIRDILIDPFNTISTAILKVLQNTPAELSADIIENGMLINGGCALIEGVDEFLEKTIGLDVHIAKNPLTAIVEGTKVLLQNRGNYYVKPVD